MALSWCKVASNLDSHPKIRKAGRCGREVFLFALRRNAEPGNPVPGRISAEELDAEYLADQLQMPVTDAVTGVTAAVTAGLLVLDGDSYAITSWKDGWGKDNGSGAERTARYRENKKLRADVTPVTSHNVTPSPSDACDIEEKRLEETRREEKIVLESPGFAVLKAKVDKAARLPSSKPFPTDWHPRNHEAASALASGLNCTAELAAFRDHHTAKGSRFTDWDAAFRTWLRNAVKFSTNRSGPQKAGIGRVEPKAPADYPEGDIAL